MRPLRLTLEGFTCFSSAQDVIEFDGLDLFAISGPTGAGKSSLLDAMIFALYGKVPRMGEREYKDIISLGRDRLSVRLDFNVGEREFRVARNAFRKKATTVQLEEWQDGRRVWAADRAQDVNRRIESLLGLNFKGFTSAVVLPQGDFARFLKSEAGERRKMLRDLLRLEVYEAMRQAASKRSQRQEEEVRQLERRLDEDYAGATPAALEGLQAEVEMRRERARIIRIELEHSEQHRAELQTLHQWTTSLQAFEAERLRLEQQRSEMSKLEQQVADAIRAEPLRPHLYRKETAVRRHQEAEQRHAAACRTAAEVTRRLAAARENAERAEAAAAERPGLNARLSQLDQARALAAPRRDANEGLQRRRRAEAELRRQLESESNCLPPLRQMQIDTARARDAAAAALGEIAFDSARLQQLEELAEKARDMQQLRARALDARRRADQSAQGLEESARQTARAQAAVEEIRQEAEAAKAAVTAAESVLRERTAHLLRRELAAGQACPVCEQTVSNPPACPPDADVDALKRSLHEALARREAAEKRLQPALEELYRITSRGEEQRHTSQEARLEYDSLIAQGQELAADLSARSGLPAAGIDEAILAAWRDESARRGRHDAALRTLHEAEKGAETAARAVAEGLQRTTDLQSRLAATEQETIAATQACDELEKQWAALQVGDDIDRERSAIESRLRSIESALLSSTAALNEVLRAETAAATVSVESARQLEEAAAEVQASAADLAQAVQEAGFDTMESALQAVLSPDERSRLQNALEQWRTRVASVTENMRDLEAKLGAARITSSEVASATAERQRLREAESDELTRLARLEQDVQRLQQQLERLSQLQEQLGSARQEFNLYRTLEVELAGSRFQQFLLEETFRELVRGASVRLAQLTNGQYALHFRDGDFMVVDHERAGEMRSTDTLSGGETFLTSLALALELSEQVQKAGGAVRLESLFIDEGFGTLDAETLDRVAGAIESLQVAGRVIGIITHLSELTARLPACFVVERRADGSRVRLVRHS